MRQGWMAWVATLAGWLLLAAGASASERVALVIGNASYQHTTTLANPVNDARDIAAALRKAGYAVEPVVENAGKAQLEAALAAFAEKAHGARQALVYYAGHGIEAAGENYLVPVDARLRNERTVSLEAVKLSDVMAVVSSAGQLGLVVLDACRDNPLAARMARIDPTRSATRGLGPPGEPGGNLMVVYAAEAGRVAADGANRNSPFTQAVLGALNAPPMEVRLFWGHVRDQVFRRTAGAQRPFTYGSLGGEAIYLSGDGAVATAPAPLAANTQPDASTPSTSPSLIEPEMVQIPAGGFEQGSPSYEEGRNDNEGPLRNVNVKAFSLGKYEVTRAQFRQFVQATDYRTDAEKNAAVQDDHNAQGCFAYNGGTDFDWKPGTSWRDPGFAQGEDHPVVCVSWNDAQAYIQWLSRETGQPYRLPSESELEYANRAGTTTPYPWGSDANGGCGHANYADNTLKSRFNASGMATCSDGHLFTAPVGSYRPNAFGVHDTAGNVLEWAEDVWHDSYAGAPTDGSAWTAGGDSGLRVLRGGSWGSFPSRSRSADRDGLTPADRGTSIGFRLARTL